MKKQLIYVLTMLVIFITGQVVAQDGSVNITTTNNASFRAGPGTDYSRLDVIPFDTTLPAIARNEDLSWIQVNYNGQVGWISSSFLRAEVALNTLPIAGADPVTVVSPQSAASVAPGSVTATTRGVLNVRSGPSANDARIGQLPPDATIVPDARWGSGSNAWLRFQFDGQQGWIASWLVTINGDMNSLPDIQAEYNAQAQARSDAAAMLPQVCSSSVTIAAAAAYTGDATIHPVRVYSATSQNLHPWNSVVSAWTTSDALATQLVACVGEERQVVLQVCEYYGPNITRYGYAIDVRLVSVQTGQVVASTTLYGTPPRECRQQEPYSLTTLTGSHVQSNQLQTWLQPFAAP